MTQSNYLFVLCSDDLFLQEHLENVLAPLGSLKTISLEQAQNPEQWQQHNFAICFMDFIEDSNNPSQFAELNQIARYLLTQHPGLPLVALGSTEEANGAIHALRSGVDEFVDPGQEQELLATAQRMLTPLPLAPISSNHQAKHIVVLGARPGVGTTTFSTHLSSYLQSHTHNTQTAAQVLLLDLGWPQADSLVYLNTTSQFRLHDALHNLHRLDQALLQSALAKTDNELHILALDNDSHTHRNYTSSEINTLFQRLTQYFSFIITDLNVYNNPTLLNASLQNCAEIWLITDQNMAALVSLSSLLKNLNTDLRKKMKLIINRYDPQVGLSAKSIAQQFDLPLLTTLPEQRKALISACSQGQLLGPEQARNPYYKAIAQLCEQQFIQLEKPSTPKTSESFLKRLFSKRSS